MEGLTIYKKKERFFQNFIGLWSKKANKKNFEKERKKASKMAKGTNTQEGKFNSTLGTEQGNDER